MTLAEIIKTKQKLKRCNEAVNQYLLAHAKMIRIANKRANIPAESGALRRASMDLTRQLAKMRASR